MGASQVVETPRRTESAEAPWACFRSFPSPETSRELLCVNRGCPLILHLAATCVNVNRIRERKLHLQMIRPEVGELVNPTCYWENTLSLPGRFSDRRPTFCP